MLTCKMGEKKDNIYHVYDQCFNCNFSKIICWPNDDLKENKLNKANMLQSKKWDSFVTGKPHGRAWWLRQS